MIFMKRILKKTWAVLRYNLGSLLLFETGYRIASFFLVMQLTHRAVNFSLKKQEFSYLTAENFVRFLSSPLSILLLLFLLLLILLLFLIEVSSQLSGFLCSYQKQKIYASDMLLLGIKRTFAFLRHSRISWIFGAALSAPFFTAYFVAREISYIRVLEFTAIQIYKAVKPSFLLYLAVGILLLISFLCVFTLPYAVLEKEKSRRAMQRGLELLQKQWKKTLSGFLVLHVLMAVFIAAVYLAAMAVMTVWVFLGVTGGEKVTRVLIYSGDVNMALGVFAGAVQLTVSLAFVYVLYARFHVQSKEEVALYRLMEHYAWFSKVGRRKAAAILTAVFVLCEGGYLGLLAAGHDVSLDTLTADMGITAHRGGARMAPENTISALAYAIDAGADWAEIDVQETKDGKLILLHDDSLKRTAGVNKKVWEMTLAQIEKLDAGSSFHRKFRGEKIPTLEEVLKFCKGRLDLNIEIKYNGKNRGIVHKVVRAIRENGFEDYCVVTSMNYGFLEQIKETAPEIRTGYIMTMTYGSTANITAADFFSVKHTYVTESFVKEAHGMGKEIHAWTVNYRGDVRRMIDMGVDNIITDDPVMVRKVQGRESGSQTGYRELLGYALGI